MSRVFYFIAALASAIIFPGCISSTATTVAVGDAITLPELTTPTESLALRLYTSINGALVRTATNSSVRIAYKSDTASDYIGIITRRATASATVDIAPR